MVNLKIGQPINLIMILKLEKLLAECFGITKEIFRDNAVPLVYVL